MLRLCDGWKCTLILVYFFSFGDLIWGHVNCLFFFRYFVAVIFFHLEGLMIRN